MRGRGGAGGRREKKREGKGKEGAGKREDVSGRRARGDGCGVAAVLTKSRNSVRYLPAVATAVERWSISGGRGREGREVRGGLPRVVVQRAANDYISLLFRSRTSRRECVRVVLVVNSLPARVRRFKQPLFCSSFAPPKNI